MTAPSIREAVAQQAEAIIAREVRCGQDPALPADDQCKTTWLPYKRHCPECPLHHTQRADVAREIADAALAVALPRLREHFAKGLDDFAKGQGEVCDTFPAERAKVVTGEDMYNHSANCLHDAAERIRADEGPA